MVLQDNRSTLATSALRIPRLELDVSRIAATSGALLLNLAVLGLLLVPATMAPMAALKPVTTWIKPIERPKPTPPPPILPVEPQTRDVTPAMPPVVSPPIEQPIAIDQVVLDEGTLQADPVVATPAHSTITDTAPPAGPVAGMALRYLRADAPPYPREQLLAGVEGTVMLRVLVDIDGKPIQVDIQTSSGSRKLDEAARRFVLRNWLFEPAMKDGQAVQATGIVPIEFNLGR